MAQDGEWIKASQVESLFPYREKLVSQKFHAPSMLPNSDEAERLTKECTQLKLGLFLKRGLYALVFCASAVSVGIGAYVIGRNQSDNSQENSTNKTNYPPWMRPVIRWRFLFFIVLSKLVMSDRVAGSLQFDLLFPGSNLCSLTNESVGNPLRFVVCFCTFFSMFVFAGDA